MEGVGKPAEYRSAHAHISTMETGGPIPLFRSP